MHPFETGDPPLALRVDPRPLPLLRDRPLVDADYDDQDDSDAQDQVHVVAAYAVGVPERVLFGIRGGDPRLWGLWVSLVAAVDLRAAVGVVGADVAVLLDGPPLLQLAAETDVGAVEAFEVFLVRAVRQRHFVRANVVAAPVDPLVAVFAGREVSFESNCQQQNQQPDLNHFKSCKVKIETLTF